jgi:signal transduction histidine kinase
MTERLLGWRRRIDWPAILCMSLYTLLIVGRRTFMTSSGISAIWPGGGVMAVAFLLGRRSSWKWVVLLGVSENLLSNGVFGFAPRTLLTIPEAGLLAYLTRRVCARGLDFSEPRTLVSFLVFAAAPAGAASAVAMTLLPGAMKIDFAASMNWFLGHALGAAIAVPTFVTLFKSVRFASFRRPAWELPACSLLLIAYVYFLFAGRSPVLTLLIFPAAMFVAFRYGPVGASVMSQVLMVMALARIYSGTFWPRITSYEGVQWVQFFVAIVFLTSFCATGALTSLRRTQRVLARRTEAALAARQRADTAARVKSEFLANMSHEIRTPLNGVIGLADALARRPLQPEDLEIVKLIQTSGKTLNGLLSDVLDLARADAGALRLTIEPFDPRELVTSAAYLFETIAREKGVGFEVDVQAPAGAWVKGDALRVRQIVANLIGNAVKFTSQGEVRVQVSLTPVGPMRSRLEVEVADTGPGFTNEVKARLFQRFEQAGAPITQRFGGTGLGLAISRQLTEMMGGSLACFAQPGVGATFTLALELDLVPPRELPQSGPLEEPPKPEGARPRILLAEDHVVNQRVVQMILADQAEIVVVPDGQAALDVLQLQVFDLVLMDNQMPVIDGLTAIRTIRAREVQSGASPLAIISLTADALPEQVQAALDAGADSHLPKPITALALLEAVQTALAARHSNAGKDSGSMIADRQSMG